MLFKHAEKPGAKRTLIARATLELALAEAVRDSNPECKGLKGIIIERIAPKSPGQTNWILKGVRYGTAPRASCDTEIAICVAEGQADFEISD
jgi:hypothetical protein